MKIYNKTDKNKEKQKLYRESVKGLKSACKGRWTRFGLNMENFEEIYKRYLDTNKCDNCHCELSDGKPMKPNTKCMDHCHITGTFRNILCNKCNLPQGVWV